MADVLVLADLDGTAPTRPTLELLTLARRVGDPVVVVLDGTTAVGPEAAAALAEHGATRVLSVVDAAFDDYLVAPRSEALHQVATAVGPALVLLPSSAENTPIIKPSRIRNAATYWLTRSSIEPHAPISTSTVVSVVRPISAIEMPSAPSA